MNRLGQNYASIGHIVPADMSLLRRHRGVFDPVQECREGPPVDGPLRARYFATSTPAPTKRGSCSCCSRTAATSAREIRGKPDNVSLSPTRAVPVRRPFVRPAGYTTVQSSPESLII